MKENAVNTEREQNPSSMRSWSSTGLRFWDGLISTSSRSLERPGTRSLSIKRLRLSWSIPSRRVILRKRTSKTRESELEEEILKQVSEADKRNGAVELLELA